MIMIEELQRQLKNDPELYYAYQANIAVAMQDVLSRQKASKPYLNREDIHKATNDGAKAFLDLFISQ